MKIGVIQASSQRERNGLLFEAVQQAAAPHTAVNFGVFEKDTEEFSYLQAAFLTSLLLESRALDFVVTGCSSGQGMMLACNSLPGVLCGYLPTPQDAYLFGRINGGNAASLPLGLNFGWCGELNLRYTLDALFKEPFGTGYPPEDAPRKRRDALALKSMAAVKPPLAQVLDRLDADFIRSCLKRKNVSAYVLKNGLNEELLTALAAFM